MLSFQTKALSLIKGIFPRAIFFLIDRCIFIFLSRKRRLSYSLAYSLHESATAQELTIFQVFQSTFDFFPRKFAACSKPPSRNHHRKASNAKTQQRDQRSS